MVALVESGALMEEEENDGEETIKVRLLQRQQLGRYWRIDVQVFG